MNLWELNQYEPSKENEPGDFYMVLRNPWTDIVFHIKFTVDGHKYVCEVGASTEEEAVGIFCMCHSHIAYANLDSVERLED